MAFSAVNSREAAHAINGSILCSILNSSACIDAFGLSSLFNTSWGAFSGMEELCDVVEVSVAVSLASESDRSRRLDLKASRSGIRMSTCWHTTSDGMNLHELSQLHLSYRPVPAVG